MADPILSVVLATDRYDTIRGVVAALRRQHDPRLVELVIALPHDQADTLRREDLTSFGRTTIVGVERVVPLAPARATAIRAAHAPFVFIGETHSYPEPGFVEALLAGFDGPYAAVVPAVENANPASLISWIAYAFDYGSWGPHRAPGPIADPLVHNMAYRRDVLLNAGQPLEHLLDHYEGSLWSVLHAAGHQAWFACDARLKHLNVTTLHALLLERLATGASVGMRRFARSSWTRRALYAAASPLIALLLFTRALRRGIGSVPTRKRLVVVPAMLVCAVAKAAGELAGYVGFDLQDLVEQGVDYEIHKVRYAGRTAP